MFNENVANLFEELKMAHKWQRPSILFAIYHSEPCQIKAQVVLENKLKKTGQIVEFFESNTKDYDIPLLLSRIEDKENKVFFISGLIDSKGNINKNAFRALNIRRELFIEHAIRMVFWITPDEAKLLPYLALDFWVFRHSTVEFNRRLSTAQTKSLINDITVENWYDKKLRTLHSQHIYSLIKYFSKIPHSSFLPVFHVKTNLTLAGLLWLKQDFRSSKKLIEQGIKDIKRLNMPHLEAQYWLALGKINDAIGNTQQAIISYQKSVDLDPNFSSTWNDLGKDYFICKMISHAHRAFAESLKINPNNHFAWQNIALLHEENGNYEEAIQSYRKCLSTKKENEYIWQKLGGLYARVGDFSNAMKSYQLARILNNKNWETLMGLGISYMELGLENKAIRAFYKATRLNPSSAKPWLVLAKIYNKTNKAKYAKKAIYSALSLDPNCMRIEDRLS